MHQHCRNKIGENCVVVWGEYSKCFVMISRPLSTQPEIWSIPVVVRTRTPKKCNKMKNASAGHAELLFLLIRAIVLWRSFPSVQIFGSGTNDPAMSSSRSALIAL